MLTFRALILVVVAVSAEAAIVTIPDENLDEIVRLTLGPYYSEPPYPPIQDYSMATLVSLYAPNRGISDLTGLEYAVNIKGLTLFNNQIANLTPISQLNTLTQLKINGNPITDLSPIAGLTNLELLWLGESDITDFDPISNLTNLTDLGLYRLYNLWSLAFVKNLVKLTELTVRECPEVFDLTPLEMLPALRKLNLEDNAITLLTALLSNLDLGPNRTSLYLDSNPLTQYCLCREVPVLVERGVYISGIGMCKGAIVFDDPRLEQIVGELVDVKTREIYTDEVVGVGFTTLHLDATPLTGLGGLDSCTDLENLTVSNAGITSIVDLHTLTKLTQLTLDGNAISDVDPLDSLTELTYLNLDNNALADTSGLEKLPKLQTLSVNSNQFTGLNRFSQLVHLRYLNLGNNHLTLTGYYDANALVNLTQLHELYLNNNQITDLTPLINSQLGEGDEVYLLGNPLSTTALTVQIPALQARGVIVHYDGDVPKPVIFADSHLEARVRLAIAKPTGTIYDTDLVGVGFRSLSAAGVGIVSLGGLEYCKDLTWLDLSANEISNIDALSGLTKLDELILNQNQIVDLSPLAGLTLLTKLKLADNVVLDCTPLGTLTNLTELDLRFNAIIDLEPLGALTALKRLELGSNGFSDLSGISTLVNLVYVDASDNQVQDLAPLAGLTKLEELLLFSNQISDVTPLTGLTKLQILSLSGNQILEVVGLGNNPGLYGGEDSVDLTDNPLGQYALCTTIPELEDREVLVEYDGACGGEGEGEGEGQGCNGGTITRGGRGSGNLLITAIACMLFLVCPRRKVLRRRQS